MVNGELLADITAGRRRQDVHLVEFEMVKEFAHIARQHFLVKR